MVCIYFCALLSSLSVSPQACDNRCQLNLNHTERHCSRSGCRYRADIGNRVFLCRQCHEMGQDQVVRWQTVSEKESGLLGMVKFLQRGYIIECPTHGIIYRCVRDAFFSFIAQLWKVLWGVSIDALKTLIMRSEKSFSLNVEMQRLSTERASKLFISSMPERLWKCPGVLCGAISDCEVWSFAKKVQVDERQ